MTRPYHFRRVVDGLVRTCRKCGEDYPFTTEYYAVARYRNDGSPILRGTCTACRTERKRAKLPPKMGASRLGPVPCQGCRGAVYWNGLWWAEVRPGSDGRRHLEAHDCEVAV
jgi:hypothetical protein